jgi:hypothetical protein
MPKYRSPRWGLHDFKNDKEGFFIFVSFGLKRYRLMGLYKKTGHSYGALIVTAFHA